MFAKFTGKEGGGKWKEVLCVADGEETTGLCS